MTTENYKEHHFHATVLVSSSCDERSFGRAKGQWSDESVFNGNKPEREAGWGGLEESTVVVCLYRRHKHACADGNESVEIMPY